LRGAAAAVSFTYRTEVPGWPPANIDELARRFDEQLGHADTRMTEKHCAHLAPSYVADTIRAHFPNLGIARENNVRTMQRS
jgi:hypothetical protein